MKKLQQLLMLATVLVLASCGKEKNFDREVEFIPFQESSGGSWGMISPEGDVLFSEEFSERPTVAVNGRFMVKNSNGLWEIYTAEKKPKQIGDEYLYASLFYEDVAPVVAKGKPIQFIDRDGEVKVTLDKIDGKVVNACSGFRCGVAAVQVGDYWGAVNTKGELVVEAKYCQFYVMNQGNRILAVDKKYADETDHSKWQYTVLNTKGKVLATIKSSKVKDVWSVSTSYRSSDCIFGDAVYVRTEKGDDTVMGMVDFDGEWVMKPSSKVQTLSSRRGDAVVFYNGEHYGLMSAKGEEIIRPKFKNLVLLDDDILAGRKQGDDNFALYNLKGEKVSKEEYESISFFWNGKYAFAEAGSHDYVLIDKKGREHELKADIYSLGITWPDFQLTSDYLDPQEVVRSLHITPNGLLDLDTSLTGPELVKALNDRSDVSTYVSSDASRYANSPITATVKVSKGEATLSVPTSNLITTTRVGGYWYSYNRQDWNSNTVEGFELSFDLSNNSKLEGKMHELYKALADAVKAKGEVVKKGKNAIVVDAGNGNIYFALWAGRTVCLYMGQYNPDTCDVDTFDDVDENDYCVYFVPVLASSDELPVAAEGYAEDGDDDWGELESPPADDL